MNQINGRAWVEALRSGEYTQGRHALRQIAACALGEKHCAPGETHCCLGVVTELAVAAGVLPPGIVNENGKMRKRRYRYETGVEGEVTGGALPQSVCDWLELDSDLVCFVIDGQLLAAENVNDGLGYSFAQIADLIETQHLTPQPINSDESN